MKSKKVRATIILGLSFILAIILVKPIGVSTEYSITSGVIQKVIQPDIVSQKEDKVTSKNAYYAKNDGEIAKNIQHPLSYGMLFVFSIPFGALLGSIVLKKKKAVDGQNIERHQRLLTHPLVLFIGGFLLLFGARWAGGCTSGHMMSGIMQSSVSGLVFAGVVFATAIMTSIVIYRKKGAK